MKFSLPHPKRTLPLVLLSAFVAPVVVMFFVTLWGVSSHERATSRVMDSYVLNVAQSVADKINNLNGRPYKTTRLLVKLESDVLFGWVSRLPGWVTVLDHEGEVVASSSAGAKPKLKFPRSIVMNRSLVMTDEKGERYSVAVFPTGGIDGFYVVAAVRWDDLLGPVVRSNRLFIFLLLTVTFSLIGISGLVWRWIIRPLKRLSDQVSAMSPGDDLCAQSDREAIYELRNLRAVICQLSFTAKDRMDLYRRYTGDMVRVQEKEKESIAREIHDGPVQAVTALMQNIRLSRMEEGEKREHYLHVAEDIANATVRDLRGMCDNLTPPWLDLGLEYALNELAERLGRYLGVRIFVSGADVETEPERVLTCYRLMQEAVSNAVKHGGAKVIQVAVEGGEDGSLVMTITDDGSGFEVPDELESLRRAGHRGLLSMRDRMRLVKGDVRVTSAPGQGTEVRYWFPPVSADDPLYGGGKE